jgi:hypothetical protein
MACLKCGEASCEDSSLCHKHELLKQAEEIMAAKKYASRKPECKSSHPYAYDGILAGSTDW